MSDSLFNKRVLINNKNSEHCSLFLYACLLLLLGILLSGCQPQAAPKQQYVFTGPIMGTEYRIAVIADQTSLETAIELSLQGATTQSTESDDIAKPKDGVKVLENAVIEAMSSVNESMSNYIEDSEISRFNRLPAGTPVSLSSDFHAVMTEALRISALSNGAFDVTLAKAIDAWGFGPDGQINRQPNEQRLEEIRSITGYQKLALEQNNLSKTVDGVELSFSAIAKGYAVDKVARTLTSLGLNDYLINIGGELRASGNNSSGNVWRVGVEKPHLLGGVQEVVLLDGASIATSGDYRNYLVVDGEQFSHTIDPNSLKPVLHKLALVSVINESAATADALATAMMAMDEERAWVFAQENKLAAYLIVRKTSADDFDIRATEEFNAYLQ